MVVKEKLVENLKSLRQVLIGKVDGRVRDARSVRSDRVGDMPNTYGVQMLAIERRARLLDKALCVQVVVVPRHEDVDYRACHPRLNGTSPANELAQCVVQF